MTVVNMTRGNPNTTYGMVGITSMIPPDGVPNDEFLWENEHFFLFFKYEDKKIKVKKD